MFANNKRIISNPENSAKVKLSIHLYSSIQFYWKAILRMSQNKYQNVALDNQSLLLCILGPSPSGPSVCHMCSIDKNKTKILQAILLDPLTSAMLIRDETRNMVDELFQTEKDYLKGYKQRRIRNSHICIKIKGERTSRQQKKY